MYTGILYGKNRPYETLITDGMLEYLKQLGPGGLKSAFLGALLPHYTPTIASRPNLFIGNVLNRSMMLLKIHAVLVVMSRDIHIFTSAMFLFTNFSTAFKKNL